MIDLNYQDDCEEAVFSANLGIEVSVKSLQHTCISLNFQVLQMKPNFKKGYRLRFIFIIT